MMNTQSGAICFTSFWVGGFQLLLWSCFWLSWEESIITARHRFMALSTVICEFSFKKARASYCTLYIVAYLICSHVGKGVCVQPNAVRGRGFLVWRRWSAYVTRMQCSAFHAVGLCSSFSTVPSWAEHGQSQLRHVCFAGKLFILFWDCAIPG